LSEEKFEILVGIASHNNVKTIGHVIRTVDAGLGKYCPDKKAVIVNSDSGSTDMARPMRCITQPMTMQPYSFHTRYIMLTG
jgi:hypothetical protein